MRVKRRQRVREAVVGAHAPATLANGLEAFARSRRFMADDQNFLFKKKNCTQKKNVKERERKEHFVNASLHGTYAASPSVYVPRSLPIKMADSRSASALSLLQHFETNNEAEKEKKKSNPPAPATTTRRYQYL